MHPGNRYQCGITDRRRSNRAFCTVLAAAITLVLPLAAGAPAQAAGVKGVAIVSPNQGAHYVKGPIWFSLTFINQGAAQNPADRRVHVIFHRYLPAQKGWFPIPPYTFNLRRSGGLDIWPNVTQPGRYRVKARRKGLGVHVWSSWVYFTTGPFRPGLGKKKLYRFRRRLRQPK